MPYTIDGQPITLEHEPQLKDGTLWVPVRGLGEALGGNLDWDADTHTAILYLGSYITTVKIGDTTVNTDGEEIELQAAPYLADGDTWVPVRFFSQPLGYNISVDLATNQVDINNPNA